MAELAVQKYVRSARVVVLASTGDWAPAGARAGYDWLRCNASGAGCRPISGSCARIRLSCGGRGCPYRRKAIAVKVVRVHALQRSYRPRATIEIRVTQPKRIGNYTLVKTRRGKAPLRVDRRLMSGSTRPVRCPAG